MITPVEIVLVVEDELSEAVLRKVIGQSAPHLLVGERVIRTGGFGPMRASIDRYKNASHVYPHVLLTDLDRFACPSALIGQWGIADCPPRLLFRVAVRSIESWILGDRDQVADLLRVAKGKIADAPDTLSDSKNELISLARRGRNKRLADGIAPARGSSAKQGPLYNAHLAGFVRERWRVTAAASASTSLARAIARLSTFGKDEAG